MQHPRCNCFEAPAGCCSQLLMCGSRALQQQGGRKTVQVLQCKQETWGVTDLFVLHQVVHLALIVVVMVRPLGLVDLHRCQRVFSTGPGQPGGWPKGKASPWPYQCSFDQDRLCQDRTGQLQAGCTRTRELTGRFCQLTPQPVALRIVVGMQARLQQLVVAGRNACTHVPSQTLHGGTADRQQASTPG